MGFGGGLRESEDGVILTFKISLIREIRTSHLFATKYLIKTHREKRKEKKEKEKEAQATKLSFFQTFYRLS